jgi:hypothetical protein
MMETFGFAVIATLFAISAWFIVFVWARRMVTLLMLVTLLDWMTKSISLVRIVLSERSRYRKRRG